MNNRWLFKIGFACLLSATLLPLARQLPAGATATPTVVRKQIQGIIYSAQRGSKVYLVDPSGRARVSDVSPAGAFSFFNLKTSDMKGATLHLVDEFNRYVGPIVLAKERVGTSWCAHTALSGESVYLHLERAGRALVPASPHPAKTYLRTATKSSAAGVPLGVASGGIVRVGTSDKSACRNARNGQAQSVSTREVGADQTELGDDTDADGLPNAFDADDDGDKVIDAVDPTTAGGSAAMNPWIALRTDIANFNANLNSSLSQSDIVAVLGNQDSYVIQFFVGNRNFVTGDVDTTINDVKYVYVDCGDLIYCGGDAPTAIDTMTHDRTMGNSTVWSTYRGGWNVEREGLDPSPSLIGGGLFGLSPAGKGNALWAMNRPSNDPERIYWRGSIFPNQGEDTLTNVRPGDVFTLNYSVGGSMKTLAMMLNPHAVTVPGLKNVNGSSYSSGPISLSGGSAVLEFYRPQRLVAGGEVGGGPDSQFIDMGGLQYGLSLMAEGHNSFSCPANTYSSLDGVTTQAISNGVGWALKDQTATDIASHFLNSTISFEVDIETCIKAASGWGPAYWADNSSFSFELTGAGTQLTGGSNTSSLQITFAKPG